MSVVKPNEFDFRGDYLDKIPEGITCAYPNCRNGKVVKGQPYVIWDADIDLNFMLSRVEPVLKFAMQEHLHPFELQHKKLPWIHYMHAECSAEWGMQLISDALKANPQVGRVLTGRGKIDHG